MLRQLLADIVLPATSCTGEGDLLPIKGDLVASSTKVDDDAGDVGACGEAEEEDDDASEVVLRKRIEAPPNIPTASSPSADVVNSSIHMSLSINPVVEPEKSNKVSKPCRKE